MSISIFKNPNQSQTEHKISTTTPRKASLETRRVPKAHSWKWKKKKRAQLKAPARARARPIGAVSTFFSFQFESIIESFHAHHARALCFWSKAPSSNNGPGRAKRAQTKSGARIITGSRARARVWCYTFGARTFLEKNARRPLQPAPAPLISKLRALRLSMPRV